MKRLFFIFILLALIGYGIFLTRSRAGDLAVVQIEGGIFDAVAVIRQLEGLGKSPEVKAVVLRVDSPGGSVGASQEIHESVKRLAGKKKVVASLGSVAASGGYYVSLPAHRIFAAPGTVTGSIGVRMEYLNVEELMRWARVHEETLKSGRWKDAGSAVRPMDPEERSYLEGILKKMHAQFKMAVGEGRHLPADKVEALSEGQLFTGEEALSLGLIDEIGNLQVAIEAAARMAGIEKEPRVFYPEREGWIDRIFGSVSLRSVVSGLDAFRPGFFFMMKPTI